MKELGIAQHYKPGLYSNCHRCDPRLSHLTVRIDYTGIQDTNLLGTTTASTTHFQKDYPDPAVLNHDTQDLALGHEWRGPLFKSKYPDTVLEDEGP